MTEKTLIFIRTKRFFETAGYWYIDAVVRAPGTGDVVITREATLPAKHFDEKSKKDIDQPDENFAREIAGWYGVPEDQWELADLEELNNDAPVSAVNSPESVPVKRGESIKLDPKEELAKARAAQE